MQFGSLFDAIQQAQEILDSLPELTSEQQAQLDDLGDWITEENPGYFFT
ncbi:MAG: hypothetical protein GY744_02900 [Gammaproteobacteria bacterium]|nr:hypothetical protein [Gammaproteobacteria bacterium]